MPKIIKFDEVTSTNDVAIDLGKKGAEHFTCIVASKQTAGRGRRGKVWTTLANKSIACSIILRQDANHLLPLVASLALHDAISSYVPCSIKWPNDILINGKKISGILAEKIAGDKNAFYVLGIGVNVKKFSACELGKVVGTSIENETDCSIHIGDVLSSLFMHLSERLKQNEATLLEDYRQRCVTIGQKVTWVGDKKTLTGTAISITDSGSLILDVSGTYHEILSGDIVAQGERADDNKNGVHPHN